MAPIVPDEERVVTTDVPMLTIPEEEKESSTIVPDEIIDEVVETTMKPEVKEKEIEPAVDDSMDEIETTMIPIIADEMVSGKTKFWLNKNLFLIGERTQ